MSFIRFPPADDISDLVDCYWFVDDPSRKPKKEKIVPDGCTEIIFHFGDPYEINITGRWKRQSRVLFAGQIRDHFYLRNTGRSKIFGIKLKPVAAARLFGGSMDRWTDRVVNLSTVAGKRSETLVRDVVSVVHPEELCTAANHALRKFTLRPSNNLTLIEQSVDLIVRQKGMVTVEELCVLCGMNERRLQRQFLSAVGVNPKLFARIIRFNNIFRLIREKNTTWSDLAYWGGYYDQSHFIKNFKAFTGDEPSSYPFAQKNLANFFLQPKPR